MHPGGAAVLRDVAGQDATSAFYNLHRHEVLSKYPTVYFLAFLLSILKLLKHVYLIYLIFFDHYKYAKLKIGNVEGESPEVETPKAGALSHVPYAEPTFLKSEFHSPYYKGILSSP